MALTHRIEWEHQSPVLEDFVTAIEGDLTEFCRNRAWIHLLLFYLGDCEGIVDHPSSDPKHSILSNNLTGRWDEALEIMRSHIMAAGHEIHQLSLKPE